MSRFDKPAEVHTVDGSSFTARHTHLEKGWLKVWEDMGGLPTYYPSDRVDHVRRLPNDVETESSTDTSDTASEDTADDTDVSESDGDVEKTHYPKGRQKIAKALTELDYPIHSTTITHISGENERWIIELDWQDISDDERDRAQKIEKETDWIDVDWHQSEDGDWYPAEKYVSADDMDAVEEALE